MPSSMNQRQSGKMNITTTDKFPAGLRILAVDDDPTCLMILAQQLRKCSYEVTMCTRATEALSILRENKDSFDLVISDVYMPDMDGFKLLEYVGLEMDLPVIMTSSHGETSVVMKGVTHGACDYLIKPVRLEELRNIWQHVVRKRRNSEAREAEASGSVEDNTERQLQQQQQQQQQRRGSDDGEYASSVNDGTEGNWKLSKRRKDDEETEHDYDDPSTLKKQRVVWSVELHQQFVNAVNHLGIDKAVPKKILELMNVSGLTRENVASHLQKYRLYLRRLSGVQAPSTPGIPQLSHHHPMASIHPQQASLLRNVQAGPGAAGIEPPVLMPMQSVGGYYRSQPPPPLMNITRTTMTGVLLDNQSSPRTPVDEVPVAGLSVLQHQLANVGGIGRGDVSGNRFLSAADSFGITGVADVRCTGGVADRNYCSTFASRTGYPARFAVDGVGGADMVGDQDGGSGYGVKLECGGSNEADDLFSIILKQQQSQVQQQHGQHGMPSFSNSGRLM